jgi:hypothetical protein
MYHIVLQVFVDMIKLFHMSSWEILRDSGMDLIPSIIDHPVYAFQRKIPCI